MRFNAEKLPFIGKRIRHQREIAEASKKLSDAMWEFHGVTPPAPKPVKEKPLPFVAYVNGAQWFFRRPLIDVHPDDYPALEKRIREEETRRTPRGNYFLDKR